MNIEEALRHVAYPLLRMAAYCANALLFGLAPVILLVLRPALASPQAPASPAGRRRLGTRLEGLVQAALAASAVTVVTILVLQAALVSELTEGDVGRSSMAAVFETDFGRWYGFRLLLLCGLATLLVRKVGELSMPRTNDRGAGILWWTTWILMGAGLLMTSSLSGHAGVAEPVVGAIANDLVHLMAGSVWFAGIVVLTVVLPDAWTGRPALQRLALLAPAVDRFAVVALVSISVAAATGVLNSLLHVGAINDLIDTGYGRSLTVKIGLFTGIVALGAINHYFVRKRLLSALKEGRPSTARRVFRRTIAIELVAALSIMGATGVLVGLPPSRAEAAARSAADVWVSRAG
jgi:putative copper export protein